MPCRGGYDRRRLAIRDTPVRVPQACRSPNGPAPVPASTVFPIVAGSVSGQGPDEVADPSIDVVTDQAHAVDAVDPPFGGFVGVPVVDGSAVHHLHLRFASEDD